jgi:hypothetical protein
MKYKWECVTEKAAFAPRDGAGALVYKSKMWLIGGWNPRDKEHFPRMCNNEVWSSEEGKSWTLEKDNTYHYDGETFDRFLDWEGRHTAGYVVHQDKMWIVGGDCNQGHYHGDVWNSSDGKEWKYVNKEQRVPWGPRVLHHTVAFNNKIWVMGGQTLPSFADADEAFYNDVWCSENGIDWECVKPESPIWTPRGTIGGSAVFKNRMWIIGGSTYSTPKQPEILGYNDVWSSADGKNWQCHTEKAPWRTRRYHDVAVFDNKLWMLEGYHVEDRNQKDVWYSEDGENWTELPDTPWKPRHAASVFVFQDALWMVAGNNMESDVWKLERI